MKFVEIEGTVICSMSGLIFIAEKRDQNMLTVLFGDDIPYIESLLNQTFTVDEGAEKVYSSSISTNQLFYLFQNISSEFFISHNNPSDSILYSSSNCDVVLFTGKIIQIDAES